MLKALVVVNSNNYHKFYVNTCYVPVYTYFRNKLINYYNILFCTGLGMGEEKFERSVVGGI